MVNPNNLRVRKSVAGGGGAGASSSSQTNQNKSQKSEEELQRQFIDEITTKPSLAFSEETVRGEIVKYFGDNKENGVELGVFKMSLIDPISKTRIRIPVRSMKCFTFPHCFDLKQFLDFNFAAEQTAKKAKKGKRKADKEKAEKKLWECPVTNCHQSATQDQLRLDGYFESILDAVESDTLEVELFPDGRWEEIEQEDVKEVTLLNATSGEREIAQIIPRKRAKVKEGETSNGEKENRKSNEKPNDPNDLQISSNQSQNEEKEREKEREKAAMEIECLTTLIQCVRAEKQAETELRIVAEKELETVREKALAVNERCQALELELAEERALSKKAVENVTRERDSIAQKYAVLEQDYKGTTERLLSAEQKIDAKNQTIELLREENSKALNENQLEIEALKKQQEESTKLLQKQNLLIQQLWEEKLALNSELASSKGEQEKLLENARFSTAQLEKSLREKAQLKTLLEEKENIIDKLKAELAEMSAKCSHMETLKSQLEERQNAELVASTTEMTGKMVAPPPSPDAEQKADEENVIMEEEGILPNNNSESAAIAETDETRMTTTTPTNELMVVETKGAKEKEVEGNSEVMQQSAVVANPATIVQAKWGTFSTPASRTDPLEASTILFVSEQIKRWVGWRAEQAVFFPFTAFDTFFRLHDVSSGALKRPSFIIWLCPDVLADFSASKTLQKNSLLKFLKAVSSKGFTFYVGGQRKNAKNLCILIAEILSTVPDAQLFSRAKATEPNRGDEELFCYVSNKFSKWEEDSVRVENLFSLCAQFQFELNQPQVHQILHGEETVGVIEEKKTIEHQLKEEEKVLCDETTLGENRGKRDDEKNGQKEAIVNGDNMKKVEENEEKKPLYKVESYAEENGEQEEKAGDISLSEIPLPSLQPLPLPPEETPRQKRSMMSMDGATKTALQSSTSSGKRHKSILTSARRRLVKAQLKASKAKQKPSGSGETDGVEVDTAIEVEKEEEKAKEKSVDEKEETKEEVRVIAVMEEGTEISETPETPQIFLENKQKQETPKQTKRSSIASSNTDKKATIGSPSLLTLSELRKSVSTSAQRRLEETPLKASEMSTKMSENGEAKIDNLTDEDNKKEEEKTNGGIDSGTTTTTDGKGNASEEATEAEGTTQIPNTPQLLMVENNQKKQETPKQTKRSSIASSSDHQGTTIGSSSKDNKQRSPLIKTKTPKKRLPWHSASKVGKVEKNRKSRTPTRSRMSGGNGSDAKKSSERFRPFTSLFAGGIRIAREGAWQLKK